MTRQHTPEPWTVSEKTLVRLDCAYLIRPVNETNYEYGATLAATSQQDARRIVACVNACRGLPTDELEQKGLVAAVGTQLLELEQQRDELLAALEGMLQWVAHAPPDDLSYLERAHAAIKKVKGGAA